MITGIFNSLYLLNWLEEFTETEHYKTEEYFSMSALNGCLQFKYTTPSFRMISIVECIGTHAEVHKESLGKFVAFLKTLKEQPITISFDYCSWIKIREAVY